MKLSQALKQKNRLAGEIARNQQILHRENARRDDQKKTVDREQIYALIKKLSEELGSIKARIATANVGIYSKLERMAEMKSHIAFLQGLPKREDTEIQFIGRDQEKLTYQWDSYVTQVKCDTWVAELEKKIQVLQDEVDTYNATTEISA